MAKGSTLLETIRTHLERTGRMQYVNFVFENDEQILHCAPVEEEDAVYLQRAIATLRPLSDDEYLNGPVAVLNTLGRYSYVLDQDAVYWLIEWAPGLIIISPSQPLAWTALRSPRPGFGGREPTADDLADYDDEAHDSQYTLVFRPWDAQFDAQDREWYSFAPAPEEVQTRFETALAKANELGEKVEEIAKDEGWFERCKQNLKDWCGDGIRLKQ
jgi:hypothetical protein